MILSLSKWGWSQADLEKYIPYDYTDKISHPDIEIRTIVHIVKRYDNDAQNLNEDSLAFLKQQFKWINQYYKNMAHPTLLPPDGKEYWIPDSRIRFVVDTILYHVDEIGWDRIRTVEERNQPIAISSVDFQTNSIVSNGKWKSKMFRADDSLKVETVLGDFVTLHYIGLTEKDGQTFFKIKEDLANFPIGEKMTFFKEQNDNCSLDLWEKYAQSDKNALHVFYTGSSKSGIAFGCGPAPYYLNVSNLVKGGDWAGAQLTAHELGHTLGLRHTDFPQFEDLPKKDKLGFIDCNTTETSNNIMGYNVCRSYLSPMQIGYVHLQYSMREDRIRLTYANEMNYPFPIDIWEDTEWSKAMVVRQDIVVRRGQKLIISEPLHMAHGATIYVERNATLVVEEGGKIYNCFGDSWNGIVLCNRYEVSGKMPRKVKDYGKVIAPEGLIMNVLQVP